MLERGNKLRGKRWLRRFVDIQYERSEDLRRGNVSRARATLSDLSDV